MSGFEAGSRLLNAPVIFVDRPHGCGVIGFKFIAIRLNAFPGGSQDASPLELLEMNKRPLRSAMC